MTEQNGEQNGRLGRFKILEEYNLASSDEYLFEGNMMREIENRLANDRRLRPVALASNGSYSFQLNNCNVCLQLFNDNTELIVTNSNQRSRQEAFKTLNDILS